MALVVTSVRPLLNQHLRCHIIAIERTNKNIQNIDMDLNCHGKRRSFSPNFVAEKTRTLANLEWETNTTPEAKTVYVVSQPSWTSLNKQSPTLCINLCHVCHRSLLPFTHLFQQVSWPPGFVQILEARLLGSVQPRLWSASTRISRNPFRCEGVMPRLAIQREDILQQKRHHYRIQQDLALNLLSVGPTKTKSGAMVL